MEKELVKEDIQELVKNSLLYKLGKVSSNDYYRYLKDKMAVINKETAEGEVSKKYGNILKYIELVKYQSQIDSNELFNEIESAIATPLGYRHLGIEPTQPELWK